MQTTTRVNSCTITACWGQPGRTSNADYWLTLKALVEAEVLDDFIEQAERLAEAGYYPAAASLGGAILEDTLRKICDHRSIEYPPKTSIEVLNVALAKAEVYGQLQKKRITHLAELRNKADHGQFDQIKRDDVD